MYPRSETRAARANFMAFYSGAIKQYGPFQVQIMIYSVFRCG